MTELDCTEVFLFVCPCWEWKRSLKFSKVLESSYKMKETFRGHRAEVTVGTLRLELCHIEMEPPRSDRSGKLLRQTFPSTCWTPKQDAPMLSEPMDLSMLF